MLANSIELDITTDEADFDTAMGQLALNGSGSAVLPTTEMRMASYAAFTSSQANAPDAASTNGESSGAPGASAGSMSKGLQNVAGAGGSSTEGDASCERLREAEALQRIASLVERLSEMEEWFLGVKAEAERERRMREQSLVRLALMQERVDGLNGTVAELRKENRELRRRLSDVSAAYGVRL